MASYVITAPDGSKWEVTAPEGASEAEVLRYAQSQWQAQQEPLSRTERIGEGLRDSIAGPAQLLTNILPEGAVQAGNRLNNWLAENTGLVAQLPEGGLNQAVREREQQYQSRRDGDGVDWWRMLGNVASPVNVALASKIPLAATLPGRMGVGALAGAGFGAMAPVAGDDYGSEKAQQIGAGAVAGGLLPVLTGGLARVISPKASTNPNLDMLRREGVTPTVGQTLGGRANLAEEKLISVPILGDQIANARNLTREQFNRAALNRAVQPVGGKVEKVGQEGVREAGDILGRAYQDALKQIKFVKFDPQFHGELGQLRQLSGALVPDMKRKFDKVLTDTLGKRMSQIKTMLPETYKKVDSEIGKMAKQYAGSPTASEKELGDALAQLHKILNDAVVRSNPQAAQALKAADRGWANLVRVEGAAKAALNNDGVFTPAQLNAAVRQADTSVRDRATARGTALMQDLANAGQQVIGNRYPDSGTAGRVFLGGVAGAGAAVDPVTTTALVAGLLGSGAMYTAPMQGLLRGAVSARPQAAQPVAQALRRATPALLPLSAQIGLGVMD